MVKMNVTLDDTFKARKRIEDMVFHTLTYFSAVEEKVKAMALRLLSMVEIMMKSI